MIKFFCSVCGNTLVEEPWEEDHSSYEICTCCGIEFGNDDWEAEKRLETYISWRKQWIDEGMKWKHNYSEGRPQPLDWSPLEQLKNVPKEFLGPGESY